MKLNLENILILIIGLILFFIMLTGCTAKKTTTSTTTKIDSLKTSNFEYVSKPIETTIFFPDLCDTITGKPRKFTQRETSGKNKAKVSFQNNDLLIDLFTAESKTKIDTIIQYKYRDKNVEEEEKIYLTPKWCYYVLIYAIFVSILFFRKLFF